MKHYITILALSKKWGGRCVAGYDQTDKRVVRLVSDESGKKLDTGFTEGIRPLNTVEAEIICSCPKEHQTENVLIDTNCSLKITTYSNRIEDFDFLVHNGGDIFGNNRYKLNSAAHLDHSFELVKFNNMSVYFEEDKAKADFYVEGTLHRWYRITDMVHEGRSELIKSGYAVVTVPPSDSFTEKSGYFKYIAAIYPTNL